MKKDIVKEFNSLDGKRVTKAQLIDLQLLAREQIRPDIYQRLEKVINKIQTTWWGAEKGIVLSIKKKAEWPSEKGLGCPDVPEGEECGCMEGEQVQLFQLDNTNGFEEYPFVENQIGLGAPVQPNEIYQYITDLIINTINKNEALPWQKSWKDSSLSIGKEALNFVTKKRYRGINYFLLNFETKFDTKGNPYLDVKNWDNPYFLTFKQIEERKGKLKKGSQGHRVIYFTRLYGHSEKGRDGKKLEFYTYDKNKFSAWIKQNQSNLSILGRKGWTVERLSNSYFPILKYYNVFNGSDIEGIEWGQLDNFSNAPKTEKRKIEVAESIVDNYPNPPKIEFRGDQPFYQPSSDMVVQTPIEQFKDPQNFYSVLFHELVHSTGHKSRLSRTFGKKGSPQYAKEELIAEMGAVFLCAESGILFKTLHNSAAYLKSWNRTLVKNMKDDNRYFFRAASAAQSASDYILIPDQNGTPKYLRKKTPKPKKSLPSKKVINKKDTGVQLGLFGSFEVPKNPTIQETLEFANAKLFGKSIFHPDVKKHIKFTKSGIKKAIVGKRGVSKIRLQLVYLAPQILKSSRLVKTEKDRKGRKQVLNIHKLNCFHTINGIEYKIFIVLRESPNGSIYYDHDAIKIKKYVVKPGDDPKRSNSAPLRSDNAPKGKGNKKKGGTEKGLASPIVLESGPVPVPEPGPEEVHGDASSTVLANKGGDVPKSDPTPPKPKSIDVKKGVISSADLMNMDFESMEFTGEWGKFMQNPAKNMKVAFYGKPKNGKTVGACLFAKYLSSFGRVLYNFADQGINKSTKDIWSLTGLDNNHNAFLTDTRDLNELSRLCASGDFDFVFIDLINTYIKRDNLSPAEFEDRFIKKYPDISFIYIMEATKSGDFRGGQDWMHLPDAIVNVEEYVMTNTGRYGMGEFIVWAEGLQKMNPKRYKELMESEETMEEDESLPIGEAIVLD